MRSSPVGRGPIRARHQLQATQQAGHATEVGLFTAQLSPWDVLWVDIPFSYWSQYGSTCRFRSCIRPIGSRTRICLGEIWDYCQPQPEKSWLPFL